MECLPPHALCIGLVPSWSCDEGRAGVDVSPLAPSSPLQSSSLREQMLSVTSRAASAYNGPFSLPALEVITATGSWL